MSANMDLIETTVEHLTPVDKVLSFLNAPSCRIVYRRIKSAGLPKAERKAKRKDGSMLYVVDYARGESNPNAFGIPDTRAFAPFLSADAQRVLYNTTFGVTDMFVTALDTFQVTRVGVGADPRWWIDPRTGDSYVVYRTAVGRFESFPQGQTLRQRLGSNNEPVGEPEEICPYAFGGGISRNGRYIGTGFRHLIIADLETGAYYQPLGEKQLPNRRNQVCSVSLPPDDSERVMHLRMPHDFFGIVDFDGTGYRKFLKPEGTAEWQTPQWSWHPDFTTVSALNQEGSWDVYIVRLFDDARLRLTWDGGYIHAHMWVGPQAAREHHADRRSVPADPSRPRVSLDFDETENR